MSIDLKAMLHRVVTDVFDQNFTVEDATSDDDLLRPAVRVISRPGQDRTAIIRASYVFMEAFIPELNVQAAGGPDEDDVESDKEDDLRGICLVVRAYLRGEGRIEQRRRLFRRGTVPVFIVEVDGQEWRLGRNSWSVAGRGAQWNGGVRA